MAERSLGSAAAVHVSVGVHSNESILVRIFHDDVRSDDDRGTRQDDFSGFGLGGNGDGAGTKQAEDPRAQVCGVVLGQGPLSLPL